VLGQTSNYTYDALNRLSTVSIVETGTGEQMSYDGFGNVTGMNGAAVWTHNPSTNRVQMNGWAYDGNGRVLTDGNGSYGWDIEGRMINANGSLNSYDPDGKLVQDGTGAFYVWSVTGQKLGTYTVSWSNGTPTIASVTKIGYFKGKRIGVAQDRLGTVRWGAGVTQTTYRSYGTETPYTAIGPEMWATYQQMGAGLDYADQRMYNPQMGKFFSPDPGSRGSANAKRPTTWNRYLYGNGDPINFFDPAGLYACDPGDDGQCGGGDGGIDGCDDDSTCGGDGGDDGGDDGGSDAANYTTGDITGYTADGVPIIGDPAVAGNYTITTQGLDVPLQALAPTPGLISTILRTIAQIGKTVGTVAIGIIAMPTTAGCASLSCPGAAGFPSVEYIEQKCTAVGPPVIVPSTNYPGGKSIEQEYLCPDGNTYTIHTLTTKTGIVKEKHARPGKPKYGTTPRAGGGE